jgi:hypothetical protein
MTIVFKNHSKIPFDLGGKLNTMQSIRQLYITLVNKGKKSPKMKIAGPHGSRFC